jgi:two-component system sensor histidine kinase QseC
LKHWWARAVSLLGPSLARRLLVSLLGAFVLVWWALLLVYWHQWAQNREATVQRTVDHVLALLPPEQSTAEAVLRVRTVDELSVRSLRFAGQSTVAGFILVDLSEPAAAPVYVAEALRKIPGLRWTLDSGCSLPGHDCIQRTNRNARWELHRVSLPMEDGQVFASIHEALMPMLLLVFPVVLLPLLLAVSSGLAPLNRLGQQLRQRAAGDLAPLPPELLRQLRHRELEPLVQSLNDLLARLRRHLAHERAFVEDVAHEMRTPMALISAQAHVLLRAESEEARQAASQQLAAGVARASHLVEQLLTLARMEAASAPPLVTIDLAEWLRGWLLGQLDVAEAAGVELGLDAPDHLHVPTEPQALASIVGNLVGNALRYAGRGAQLEMRLTRMVDGAIELCVQDDGPGIQAADQGHIFNRFQRGQGPDSDDAVQGSGLGLAIVKQACERLGLQLSLQSPRPDLSPARGCRFLIRWPAA